MAPLVLCCHGWSGSARAEELAAVEMARDRFEEGVTYFDAERYEEARAAFLQAYALKPHPAILLNLGLSELRGGHYLDAASHLTDYLRAAPQDAFERVSAERALTEARAQLGELRLTTPSEEGELYVDGASVGHLPLLQPLFLTPGLHRVRLRRGSDSVVEEVHAVAGAVHGLALSLPTDDEARLSLTSHTAQLEPIPTESAPPAGPSDAPAAYPSFGSWLLSSPAGTTGLVLTGTGLALGIAGTIVASERYDSARDATRTIEDAAATQGRGGTICAGGTSSLAQFQNACGERQRRLDQGDTWRALAIGGYVGAAVVAAGTVGYYFLASPSSEPRETASRSARTRVVPIATPHVQGLSIIGTF